MNSETFNLEYLDHYSWPNEWYSKEILELLWPKKICSLVQVVLQRYKDNPNLLSDIFTEEKNLWNLDTYFYSLNENIWLSSSFTGFIWSIKEITEVNDKICLKFDKITIEGASLFIYAKFLWLVLSILKLGEIKMESVYIPILQETKINVLSIDFIRDKSLTLKEYDHLFFSWNAIAEMLLFRLNNAWFIIQYDDFNSNVENTIALTWISSFLDIRNNFNDVVIDNWRHERLVWWSNKLISLFNNAAIAKKLGQKKVLNNYYDTTNDHELHTTPNIDLIVNGKKKKLFNHIKDYVESKMEVGINNKVSFYDDLSWLIDDSIQKLFTSWNLLNSDFWNTVLDIFKTSWLYSDFSKEIGFWKPDLILLNLSKEHFIKRYKVLFEKLKESFDQYPLKASLSYITIKNYVYACYQNTLLSLVIDELYLPQEIISCLDEFNITQNWNEPIINKTLTSHDHELKSKLISGLNWIFQEDSFGNNFFYKYLQKIAISMPRSEHSLADLQLDGQKWELLCQLSSAWDLVFYIRRNALELIDFTKASDYLLDEKIIINLKWCVSIFVLALWCVLQTWWERGYRKCLVEVLKDSFEGNEKHKNYIKLVENFSLSPDDEPTPSYKNLNTIYHKYFHIWSHRFFFPDMFINYLIWWDFLQKDFDKVCKDNMAKPLNHKKSILKAIFKDFIDMDISEIYQNLLVLRAKQWFYANPQEQWILFGETDELNNLVKYIIKKYHVIREYERLAKKQK